MSTDTNRPSTPIGPAASEILLNADIEPDVDGDGFGDASQDAFPADLSEWINEDHDGVGSNADPGRRQ